MAKAKIIVVNKENSALERWNVLIIVCSNGARHKNANENAAIIGLCVDEMCNVRDCFNMRFSDCAMTDGMCAICKD